MSVQEVLPVRITDWQRNFAANETRTVERDRLATSLIGRARALVFADQAGTLYLEETDNRAGAWTTLYTLAVVANVLGETPWTNLSKRWFRWRYVNGATAQTEFIVWEDKAGRPVGDTNLTGRNLISDYVAARLTDGTNWAQFDAQKNLAVGVRDAGSGSQVNINAYGALDGVSTGIGHMATSGFRFDFNGTVWDRARVANKSARAAFTAATSVVIATPGATKKLNPQGRIVITGITAGENVDLRDGGIAGTIIKSKAADAQGNAEFYYPEGGTAGRLSAVNNTLAATWTTAKTGSAHADYNEE